MEELRTNTIKRKNRIIEYVLQMEPGATAPITDPTAIPILLEANNSKVLGGCLEITREQIRKKYATELEELLAKVLHIEPL